MLEVSDALPSEADSLEDEGVADPLSFADGGARLGRGCNSFTTCQALCSLYIPNLESTGLLPLPKLPTAVALLIPDWNRRKP